MIPCSLSPFLYLVASIPQNSVFSLLSLTFFILPVGVLGFPKALLSALFPVYSPLVIFAYYLMALNTAQTGFMQQVSQDAGKQTAGNRKQNSPCAFLQRLLAMGSQRERVPGEVLYSCLEEGTRNSCQYAQESHPSHPYLCFLRFQFPGNPMAAVAEIASGACMRRSSDGTALTPKQWQTHVTFVFFLCSPITWQWM